LEAQMPSADKVGRVVCRRDGHDAKKERKKNRYELQSLLAYFDVLTNGHTFRTAPPLASFVKGNNLRRVHHFDLDDTMRNVQLVHESIHDKIADVERFYFYFCQQVLVGAVQQRLSETGTLR
jgi:hypothetical protein